MGSKSSWRVAGPSFVLSTTATHGESHAKELMFHNVTSFRFCSRRAPDLVVSPAQGPFRRPITPRGLKKDVGERKEKSRETLLARRFKDQGKIDQAAEVQREAPKREPG